MNPPPFKKRAPVTTPVQEPKVKPPRSEVRTAVRMPGKTLTSRLIKPVGMAIAILCLIQSTAWAASTSIKAPQGAMPSAAADALISASVAPFACAAAHGGVYVDTSCAQVCVCVTADAKWARSDTGVEGSATDCC